MQSISNSPSRRSRFPSIAPASARRSTLSPRLCFSIG